MNYIGKFITNFKDFYREINSATLTGAIDVVIIRQEDGTYLCSPFHVRFGKIDVLRSKEKIVDIEVNDEPVEIFMKLGDNGEAFFVEECTEDNENSNSTTRVMCKKIEVEKMKLDDDDDDENNLTEFNLYENDFNPQNVHEQLDSIEERDENNLNDQLEELNFVGKNPTITRTKSIPISTNIVSHEIHPYSDGECTPFNNNSPKADFDRPFSPKSDTEYEITRSDNKKTELEEEVCWQWGELPQVTSRKVSVVSKTSDQGLNDAILNHNLNNNRAPDTIKEDENSEQVENAVVLKNNLLNKDEKELKALREKRFRKEGIYLDEINPENIDPEVADLYFPKLRSTVQLKKVSDDETDESGKGLSLPSNSPQRENGSLTSGSDLDEKDDLILDNNKLMSDDHKLDQEQLKDKQPNELSILNSIEQQDQQQIQPLPIIEQITEQPQVDLSIVSKHYADLAISLCGGTNSIDDDIDDEKFNRFLVNFDKFAEDSIAILQNQNLVVRLNGKYFNFQIASSFLMSVLLYQKELPANQVTRLIEQQQLLNSKKKESANQRSWWSWRRSYSEKSPQPKIEDASAISPKKFKSVHEDAGSDTDLEDLDDNMNMKPDYNLKYKTNNKEYKKVLRLGSKDIQNLNLRDGANEVQFSVTTAYQGTSRCKCHVYLWNYDDKIIISDIDGTITKSDVLGHILPRIGRDWAQSGVANLFTKIKENGYKLLYLSARAIGQAEGTREYLKSVRQGEVCLPDGPLLLSPTSLLSAFHREVIEKKPEEFKISCLKDIQALFPSNPFYAGFGNKINDTWAYRAVGIPLYRIFTINHKGELKLELIQTFQSSYTKLTSVVDHMFPPLEDKKETECLTEYTSFNYWRDLLPIEEIQQEIEREKKVAEEQRLNSKLASPKSASKK